MEHQAIIRFINKSLIKDIVGTCDLLKLNSIIMWDGKPHRYLASGLAREVYISPCKRYVLKVPIQDDHESNLDEYILTGKPYHLSVSASHNLFEAKCYSDAPRAYKRYLAKTTLLPNFWVKQEFVDVHEVAGLGIREIGVKKGKCVLFDYDIMLSDFQEPILGFNYEILPKLITKAELILSIK